MHVVLLLIWAGTGLWIASGRRDGFWLLPWAVVLGPFLWPVLRERDSLAFDRGLRALLDGTLAERDPETPEP